MPDFFMRTRRGWVIPKFLVCTQRILGGGGGAMLKILCVTKAVSY